MRGFRGDSVFEMQDEILALREPPSSERVAFFGDLHFHTTYAFDAYG